MERQGMLGGFMRLRRSGKRGAVLGAGGLRWYYFGGSLWAGWSVGGTRHMGRVTRRDGNWFHE